MRFERVELACGGPAETADFYRDGLGLPADGATVRIGETELAFATAADEPFYHFALLVPGDRFEAAIAWARGRVELLPDRETGDVVFDFSSWDALACYFHDPAGNVVELIAHHGLGDSGTVGAFAAGELIGLSELGLVGDTRALARELEERLGLRLWDGTLDEPARLAFVGQRARTLILAPPGRGWLPTGRPGEPHPVEVEVDAGRYSYLTETR